MPGLSGIGLLRILRRLGKAPPAIVMTAFPDRSVETFARNAGAVTVMRKPIEGDAILEALKRLCPAVPDGP